MPIHSDFMHCFFFPIRWIVELLLSLLLIFMEPIMTLQLWFTKARQCAAEGDLIAASSPPPLPPDRLHYDNVKWSFILLHLCFVISQASSLTIALPHKPSHSMNPNNNTSQQQQQQQHVQGASDPMVASLLSAFQQLLAQAGSSGVSPSGGLSSVSPPPVEQGIRLVSGMGFRTTGDRTSSELDAQRLHVTRANRKALQSKPEALKKLRDRVCVPLEHELKEPTWSEILDGDESGDMGASVMSTQTAIDGVIEFARRNDLYYVGEIPMVTDMWDETQMVQCRAFTNVLTNYASVPLDTVVDYQHLLNVRGFDEDIESNDWLQQVLEQSTDANLLIQVKQTIDSYTSEQRGGVLLYKLIVDRIANPSYEFIKVGVKWIENFKLSNFEGENVPIAKLLTHVSRPCCKRCLPLPIPP